MNSFNAGRFSLGKFEKTYIMGILNVTPDSFSDGGKYFSLSDAVSQTEKMIEEGADIIDIGAVSTRPFSEYVSPEEEWNRLRNVLYEIRRNYSVPLSIDTFNPCTAERCLDMGADIINDVSGVFSSEMAEIIKKYDCGWIMMHGGVALRKTEAEVQYKNGIINDINAFFDEMQTAALESGIAADRICFDAGFGFSKNNDRNIELLERFGNLKTNGRALLSSLSRKRFIGELTGEADSKKRDEGTLAANIVACMNGADIIRVHNVALHRKTFDVLDKTYLRKMSF